MLYWDSLASGHLGPLLLKIWGIWGWFYSKNFSRATFLFPGSLSWLICFWVICLWNKFEERAQCEPELKSWLLCLVPQKQFKSFEYLLAYLVQDSKSLCLFTLLFSLPLCPNMIRPVDPRKSQEKAIYGEVRTPSVLARFNVLLRFFSSIGIFPCSFEEDSSMTPIKPWIFLSKWIVIVTILLGGYLAALWYMLDQSDMGFTWDSFTEYLKNFVSSTITILDAAAFVGPIFLTIYMGLGLIWSSSSIGQPIMTLEDHIRLNMPTNSKRLTFWEFLNVAIGPLL